MNYKRDDITPEIVRELLDYDPDTGHLKWRARTRKWFSSDRAWKNFNAQFAGKPALTATSKKRYRHGLILGFTFSAHQVAFAHHHGRWPTFGIDHDNGDGFDNRISNLFDRPQSENCKNKRLRKDNTSGQMGVCRTENGQWAVTIGSKYLGTFEHFDKAISVRKAAEQQHGFHPNHGRAA
ncbi:MAG: HNH endonuclease [Pseudomonadota bacterium]